MSIIAIETYVVTNRQQTFFADGDIFGECEAIKYVTYFHHWDTEFLYPVPAFEAERLLEIEIQSELLKIKRSNPLLYAYLKTK